MSGDKFFEEKTIDQLKELAESIRFAIMGTNLKSLPPHFIPMTTDYSDKSIPAFRGKVYQGFNLTS